MSAYDALLVVSFGGPEAPEEVMPFLERVVAGRGVPKERLLAVAEHYQHFGGKSPINERTRELCAALRTALPLPVYWGNRNWHPFLADTLREMRAAGVGRALALATSAFSSYSGCRAYLESIERARAEVEGAPVIDKIRPFFDHPGYLEVCRSRLEDALAKLPPRPHVLFSAHSIPMAMARGCDYRAQLEALATEVARGHDLAGTELVFQSRSGPPQVPWLEPDVGAALARLPPGASVVVHPIGFVSDHMEVVWDLDNEARAIAEARGLRFVRAGTAGAHPRMVSMVAELVAERLSGAPRLSVLLDGPRSDVCRPDCCPLGRA